MRNFQIFYDALKATFQDKEVPFPTALALILEPPTSGKNAQATVLSPIPSNEEGSNYSTEYECEESVPILVIQDNQENILKDRRLQSQAARGNGRGRGRRARGNNSSAVAASLARPSPPHDDPLDSPADAEARRAIYKDLYRLVHGIRLQKGQTTSKYANYQWPPLLLQVVRCRYPSGIKNYENYREPDVIFTDESFVDVFQ
ncbi:unnamed protein product [Adineta ricciae]|uniref:Uncharacterized protein n=1 Tax=Adineta ricciae TaxID=249248 RepID=A0A816DYM3_ADIRI|nr:unnamed protein product [Adineta ricciae]CAF1639044.1 unnamed protein product [Adineta ricciae]